jgi:hypothetical protein
MGFVAHIPHYAAQLDYPSASAALLESVEDVTGLLGPAGEVPSADELGAEFERFLAGLDRPHDD